jgi:SEFIR domain
VDARIEDERPPRGNPETIKTDLRHMNTTSPPRVFASYSHDSPEHEERVLALSNRLRADGVDVALDQYEGAPAEGWPFWMEKQIREADFVLVICTDTYLRRVERREDPNKGQGVVWEINSIYNRLYSDKLVSDKFIPVLLEGGSPADIPMPLQGFTHYRIGTETGYNGLYRRLTNQLAVSKPALGHLKSLPAKERSPDSLPNVFSLEQLSKTMSNPRYAEDIFKLDRIYDRHSVINKETVIIVVGTTIVTELLDRPAAELLRDHIDQRGGKFPFRRGIVLADQAWYAEAFALAGNPVIAVGGPPVNKLSDEFDKWSPPPPSKEGKYTIPGTGMRTGFFRKNPAGLPQVGLWGNNANATRETVEHYFRNEQGLTEFLMMCWK